MSSNFTLALTGQSLIKNDTRNLDVSGFEKVKTILRSADLAFTNFEGTILGRNGGWPLKGSFFGSSEPIVLDALKDIGFRAVALSNNHAFDLGPSGVLSTLEEVEGRGFLHSGIGRNQAEAATAGVGEVAGRSVAIVAMDGGPGPDFMYAANASSGRPSRPGVNRLRLTQVLEVDEVAFEHLRAIERQTGYTRIDLTNDSQPDDPPSVGDDEIGIARAIFKRSGQFGRSVKVDEEDIQRNLAAIKASADQRQLVVAYLHHHHWASDWYQVPGWVSVVAKRCIDAGASMFVSHGAPVLQPVELYRGRPIFYSLGNFIFHVKSEKSLWTAPEVWESVIPVCTFGEDNRLKEVRFFPVIIGGEDALSDGKLERRVVPELVTGAAAHRILHRFVEQSIKLGTHAYVCDDVAVLQIE
ncbi:poly-gamma-glutamate capsule biosynthesis protein CapA/YwtB (metallophosphatase superfamily) [Agrobacterium larrymoorei]|uniref:Poly-gamma-glutamate capsule biosynthesis protein CapA/YwtB (Metallophosphatase superfamily) n=1 Tax=Agrobacterium larrymoorei TaxID=160699 RepID=A0AAJ2BIW1_9HYPH|nr:CapA family protein [Agrobacterium larrymoorei]MDR6100475.1 poly-gamma-glutamate capsule biosynthesis protein CapA/YwtB (metallophosphatase superfamily) [Agrobacterium larrymoorei]